MNTRRALVWIGSVVTGFAAAYITIFVLFNTTIAHFSMANAVLVFLSIGALVFIWLDFILQTKYLRS
jgi:hypothetical protein